MKLAVIGTFYGRHERTPDLVTRVMVESTRSPDEFWIMCEGPDDAAAVPDAAAADERVNLHILPTPTNGDGYAVIPYSHKINWALDRTTADAIVYLDNGSMPHVLKYEVMARTLEQDVAIGAVYCGQRRTGFREVEHHAELPIADAYCVLNYTQVMHRRTDDRWTLDMQYARPDLADALFWRSLHQTLGEFHPVGIGHLLDEHHMEGAHAVGL